MKFKPRSWQRHWIRKIRVCGYLYVSGFFVLCVSVHVSIYVLFKCGSGMESFCLHISLESLIRHGQQDGNGKTQRLLGKEADSTSGRFCNAIFSDELTKYLLGQLVNSLFPHQTDLNLQPNTLLRHVVCLKLRR